MHLAFKKNAGSLVASSMDAAEWDALKGSYQLGDFTTPCCAACAIPKTSPNGTPFFAHHVGECTTAPETIWHLNAKALLANHLDRLGVESSPEKRGGLTGKHWIADILFTSDERKIAIELQHSYQTLAEYRTRQKRYEVCGVECYWLLFAPRYSTLSLSMAKWRLRNELRGAIPECGFFSGCVSDLPVAQLDLDPEAEVRGPSLSMPLVDWLASILERRFHWDDGAWVVSAPADAASLRP